jgi:hypothetical protein
MAKKIYIEVLKDRLLQAKLVFVTGKTFSTIWRWANDEDERLTTLKTLKVINEHLKGESTYFLNQMQDVLIKKENNK